MDNLFDLRRGTAWGLEDFCNELNRTHSKSSQFGAASIQHRKRLYNDFYHEFVVLDVVPLIPGTSTPHPEGSHTYIEIGRATPRFGGVYTIDQVIVLLQDDVACILAKDSEGSSQDFQSRVGECLATLSWPDGTPNLLDVFSLITQLSLAFPYYSIFIQYFWLARAIHDILRIAGFYPFIEDRKSKRDRFPILISLVTPRIPPAIVEFCKCQRRWRELASIGGCRGRVPSGPP